ncbi:MAG: FAD-dependent oxidoreductase [Clostridia bacterium]|nr:FAD-dependent oxidoreductase [Clostridia bacterium]
MIIPLDCDFLVVGAGLSGICAAIQAGRLGIDTVIIEKEMTLGGNAGPLFGVGPSGAHVNNEFYTETGIVAEIEERLSSEGARPVENLMALNTSVLWDRVISEMLLEAGVRIFRKHLFIGAVTYDKRITEAKVLNIENLDEIQFKINGYIMDATGDAHVAAMSGAEITMGCEAKFHTGERSAPDEPCETVSAASLMAITAYTGKRNPFIPPPGTPKWNKAKPANTFNPKRKYNYIFQVDEGGASDELHPLKSPQELYESLVTRIYSIWDYFKNDLYKGKAEEHELIWISPILGRRESRRIIGDYLLTQTDCEENHDFDDAAGFGGFYLDYHPPSSDGGYETYFFSNPLPYQIPLRCLYSKNISNLFSAGRNISASHIAFTSTRVMRTGGLLAQSAAICASMCIEKGVSPRTIVKDHINEFQLALRRNDVFIPGVSPFDKKNLVEKSKITATSEDALDMIPDQGNLTFFHGKSDVNIYSFPRNMDRLFLYVRNRRKTPGKLSVTMSYGKTGGIELYDHHNTGTGKNYKFHYPIKEEKVTKFNKLIEKTLSIPPHYEGWAAIECRLEDFMGPDRKTVRKCIRVTTTGSAGIARAKRIPDYMDGDNIPLIRIEPVYKPGGVANIKDGFIHREGIGLLHQWTSRYGAPLPQSVTIDFGEEVLFDTIELVFDTTERKESDMFYYKGEKSPSRCAKEFMLEIIADGKKRTIFKEDNNTNRFRKIHLEKPAEAEKLILTVCSNISGKGPARVYDIRVY